MASRDEDTGRRPGSSRKGRSLWPLILAALLLISAASAAWLLVLRSRASAQSPSAEWGVTFSIKESRHFGLDWRANYLAIVNDLKPSGLRLVAYWDLVEPTQGRYDFRDLDWQFDQAEKAGVPVILAVGQKTPRWPEYHLPKWLDKDDSRERQERVLAYLAATAAHYKDRRTLVYWQVENEPFVAYGTGPKFDEAFLRNEIEAVRRVDPAHEILETDGGEWGKWDPSARLGDAFGTTLYRRVYRKAVGSFSPSRTPEYYRDKVQSTRRIVGKPDQRFICSELQAEPWGDTLNYMMTIEQQERFFPLETFDENVAFARKTGLTTFYLWGAEWWYYAKTHGHPGYWERARKVIQDG